jgi:hypothetical protein
MHAIWILGWNETFYIFCEYEAQRKSYVRAFNEIQFKTRLRVYTNPLIA